MAHSPLLNRTGPESAVPHGTAAPVDARGVTAPEGRAPAADVQLDAYLAELQRRHTLLQAISIAMAELLSADDIATALTSSLARIARVIHIDRMNVVETSAWADGTPRHFRIYSWASSAAASPVDFDRVNRKNANNHELHAWMAPVRQGQALFGSQRSHNPMIRQFLEEMHVTSMLLVPITIRGRHWGQIGFDDCEQSERDWSEEEIDSLKMFAVLVGIAITRERSIEQLRSRDELLQAVMASASEIMTAPYLHEAISQSLEKVARAVRADRMFVLEIVQGADGLPQPLHRNSWHAPDAPLELQTMLLAGRGPTADEYLAWTEPLRRGEAISGSVSTVPPALKGFFEQLKLKSTLIVPIMVDGKYWGMIGFDACSAERQWSAADIGTLKTLADLIGTAITRERYVTELGNANAIVQNSPTVLYRLRGEPSFPMVYVSQNISLFGHDPAELLNSPTLYQSYVHAEDRARVQSSMVELLRRNAPAVTIEYRMMTGEGASRWVENRYTPVRDSNGRLVEVEGIVIDVTDRKAAEDKIAQLARTDALTGLANRATFTDRLRQAFAAARRGSKPFGVLYLDLDRFKEINDTLGHSVGDRLLQEVATRLRGVIRDVDLAARLGGDEFGILQADVTDTTAAGVLAAKIIAEVSKPYFIEGNDLHIGASIGISLFNPMGVATEPDELLAQADQALYRAKDEGRGQYRFHTAELDSEARERVALTEDLRSALEHEQLELYYQPQVVLSSGRITGMEALIRWNHPTRGLLLPQSFLPIAEKSGLMPTVGRWVLDRACGQLRQWRDASMQVPVVAVNVSLSQVRQGRDFVRDVTESLARWQLQPQDLELDVTELILARTTLAQSNVLEELHDLGVRIAIDDFGTQYSSLDYLRTYHVSRLKISRPMVTAATTDRADSAMIRAIMSLASELGIEVIAEGVETEEQRKHLVQLGETTKGQGFLFSTPVRAEETLEILRRDGVAPG